MIRRVLFFLMCVIPHFTYAQLIHTIKGRVVDSETGRAVTQATIISHSTKHAIVTDDNGNFQIECKAGDTLKVSHVSYITRFIPIPTMNNILSIKLIHANVLLEDVTINTGYQKLKPNEVNGSYVVIDNKMLNQQTGTNILDRLNGVTSSLLFNVGKQNNNPQNNTNISIRGLSTINGPLDPLIVVDNFIYDGDINNINPNDVESVTVLKDAAATSIWGARAGNGVIVITTKKGKFNEKLSVDFNSSVTISDKPDLYYLPQISSSDYIDLEEFLFNKGFFNKYFTSNSRPAIPQAVMVFNERKNGLISEKDSATQIDMLKQIDSREAFSKYYYVEGVTQQYSLGLHGGSKSLSYILSGSFNKGMGNLRDKNEKINLRFENTFRPVKNLIFNAGAYYTNSNNRTGLPEYKTLITLNGNMQVPYLSLAGPNGEPIAVPHSYNTDYIDTAVAGHLFDWGYYPLDEYHHYFTETNTEELLGHVGLQYHIIDGLDVSLQYQYQKQMTENNTTADTASYYARNLINTFSQLNRATGIVTYIIPVGGIMTKSFNTLNSYNFRGQLNLAKTYGDQYINVLAGMEVRDQWTSGISAMYYGYNSDPLTYNTNMDFVTRYPNFLTGGTSTIPETSMMTGTENRFISLFSNASYIYKKRYILTGSMRKDGSNIFGADANDRWKPLYSFGGGWVLSSEDFYHISWLPYLKFSLTYGVSGNVDLSKSAQPVAIALINNLTGLNIQQINTLNNPSLSWEHAYQTNLKMDFVMLKNRLSGIIEYYKKRGTDLYAPTPYDYTTWGGSATIVANVADMKGHGIDLALRSLNINSALKWTTNFLFNYNTNKTTSYFTPASNTVASFLGNGTIITPVIGKPLYAIAAYKWGGLDKNGNPQGYLNDTLSEDYNGITRSPFNEGLSGGSFVYIGSATPVIYGSILNEFILNRFSLSFNITYKLGYYLIKPSLNYSTLVNGGYGGADFDKRWQQPGDETKTDVPSFIYPVNSARESLYVGSTQNVIKGDHIRLQFLNIAYTFPGNKNELPFKNLQFYFNASNLGILWRANNAKIDPDFVNSIPNPKTYTIGLRANF